MKTLGHLNGEGECSKAVRLDHCYFSKDNEGLVICDSSTLEECQNLCS